MQDNLKLKGKKMGDENAHGSKVQKRNANRPKRALSAYLLFMQDFRKKNIKQNWDVTDVVKKGETLCLNYAQLLSALHYSIILLEIPFQIQELQYGEL